ncbi:hypothetical protein [Stenotrophomonas maltophilia]|uniref:Transmembrane protein n=1 Tax=Stenotrophomonas maltophilia TaxID=40324 RepID=A0A2W6I536_STEMA|nr:hypothetical protein [Stenotrophomonas maltophilia]PZS90838.1 hypothetical protein A7X83_01050 [Stenotrophomonas maltophilia]
MSTYLVSSATLHNLYVLFHEAQAVAWRVAENISKKDYISAFATLAAAFFGAMFAFRLQQREKDRERRELQIARANEALQRVIRMLNIVGDYRTKVVDPVRHMGQAAAVSMKPTLSEDVSRERFDVADLSFMVTKEEQQAVFDLWLEERRFHTLMQAIDRRTKIHLDEYQPIAEAKKLHERRDLTLDALRTEVGPRVIDGLTALTSYIIKDVDDTLASLTAAKDTLRAVLKLRFPGQKFLDFELIKPEISATK